MVRNLQFLKGQINREAKLIGEIFDNPELLEDVPNEKGIYIIVSKGEKFIYPKKKSPILYIGMSNNLRTRYQIKASH